MAVRRRIANVASMLLDQRMRRRTAEHEAGLRAANARQADEYNTQQQLLATILSNPQLARSISKAHPRVAGIDTSTFVPSHEQSIAPVAEAIEKGEIDSAQGVFNRARGLTDGDISPLFAQLGEKRRVDRAAVNPVKVSQVGTDGVMEDLFVNPFDAAEKEESFQTERTGTQEGARLGQIAVAEAPGKVLAENTFNTGTAQSAAAKAGQVSRATADATNASETAQLNDPRYAAGRAKVITAEETARAKAAQAIIDADPMIKNLAATIAENPEMLKDLAPTQRGKVLAALHATEFQSARQRSVGRMLDTAWGALDRVEGNPGGMEGATGFRLGDPSRWTWSGEPIQGTSAADFATDFDQLKSALTLPNLEYLRGLGHMSDREFATVAQSASSLDRTRMSEPKMQATLKLTREILKKAYERAGLTPPQLPADATLESGRSKLAGRKGGIQ